MKAEYKNKPHVKILQEIYKKALCIINEGSLESLTSNLDKKESTHLKTIFDNFEKRKALT